MRVHSCAWVPLLWAVGFACTSFPAQFGATGGSGTAGPSSPSGATTETGGTVALDGGGAGGAGSVQVTVSLSSALKQSPEWYESAEAAVVASNLLYYQNVDGGWPKDLDIVARTKPKEDSTIDNSATTSELVFLAKSFTATQQAALLDAFNRGIDYLLKAQYPDSGGWPQEYPDPTIYHAYITYNDNAMVRVMTLLRDVGNRLAPDYAFVDQDRATQSLAAVERGIQCMLMTQIVVEGVKNAWCAQHYPTAPYAPAPARAYELVSNSGSEGSGVLKFLMTIDHPSAEIVDAIQSATRWFDRVRISGLRTEDVTTDGGADVVAVDDPAAPPIWARFYEIGTDTPFFCGRDGIKKYSLAEIEQERRAGYAWYGDWPSAVLAYYGSTWQPKWAPNDNVLGAADAGP